MAKEYIEREAVNKVIKQLYCEPAYQHDGEDYYTGVCAVGDELATLPTADVVEVVRCKNCVDYNGHRYCYYHADPVMDDDYCSYGEKIDGMVLQHKVLGKSQDGECGVEILNGKGDA